MNIEITKSDVGGCHKLSRSSETTIVRFVNRKYCYAILSKNFPSSKIEKSKLGFEPNVKLYVDENLTPYNLHLAWKCKSRREQG